MQTRGQLESSFQWIFVLIAGGAFLFLTVVLFRSCTQHGEAAASGAVAGDLASQLESLAWQQETYANASAEGVRFSCVGDVLTVSSGDASSPIGEASVFLPPEMHGTLRMATRQLSLSAQGSPEIALGSALYGVDDGTYYLVLRDAGTDPVDLEGIFGLSANIVSLDAADVSDPAKLAARVPQTARAVVLVSPTTAYVANAGISRLPPGAALRAVVISSGQAQFYDTQGDTMRAIARMPAEDPMLALGAAVSSSPDAYACARSRLIDRARRLTRIYELRAASLSREPSLSQCATALNDTSALLAQIDAKNGTDYLGAVLGAERTLSSMQSSLRSRSCPVIA